MNRPFAAAMLGLLLVTPISWAQSSTPTDADHSAHHGGAAAAPASADLTDGEVRKLDKEARKLTIRHGEIKNLQMPPMTMVFEVADPSMLDRVKQGDKVRFRAEQVGGAYTVTSIEPMR